VLAVAVAVVVAEADASARMSQAMSRTATSPVTMRVLIPMPRATRQVHVVVVDVVDVAQKAMWKSVRMIRPTLSSRCDSLGRSPTMCHPFAVPLAWRPRSSAEERAERPDVDARRS